MESQTDILTRDVQGGARTKIRRVGRGQSENLLGGTGRKKRVNQLIQKFHKSANIVIGRFVIHYGVMIKKNITSSHF